MAAGALAAERDGTGATAAPPRAILEPARDLSAVLRLSLTAFRSYGRADIAAEPGPIVVTGPNGTGKTNLLEALSLLVPGRGLRRVRFADLDRRMPGGAAVGPGWAISARLAAGGEIRQIGTGADPDRDPGDPATARRVVRIDGKPQRGQSALADLVRLIWLTPEMDRLFADGASERRRFLDRIVFAFVPGHAGHLSAYEQAMRERNRLLAEGSGDESWLNALEAAMAEHGIAVAAARAEAVAALSGAVVQGVGAFPIPSLALAGDIDGALPLRPALAVEDEFRVRLAAQRRRDAEAGRALDGVHRSDLVVHHSGTAMPAATCSTGEQKALLIALLLAAARLLKARHGAPPILLFDEIAAHLDSARRVALFDEILALGAQAWLTGTDAASFAPLAGRAQFLAYPLAP